jgi:hypothetical protein
VELLALQLGEHDAVDGDGEAMELRLFGPEPDGGVHDIPEPLPLIEVRNFDGSPVNLELALAAASMLEDK